jgi:hypothetical protein
MAITTLDQVVSGLLNLLPFAKVSTTQTGGGWKSVFYSGHPGSWPNATANAAGLAGAVCTKSTVGALQYPDPGGVNTHIAGVRSSGTVTGSDTTNPIIVADRLWHNSGLVLTSTSAQTINSVAFPARDINQSTNGEGVYIGFEISSNAGAGTPTFSLSYTNSAGVAGRTSNNIIAVVSSSTAGIFHVMGLQAGDTGVRSIQSFTLSASMTSGVAHLVAFRPLTLTQHYNVQGQQGQGWEDACNLGMPQVWPGSCLMMLGGNPGRASYYGKIDLTQG